MRRSRPPRPSGGANLAECQVDRLLETEPSANGVGALELIVTKGLAKPCPDVVSYRLPLRGPVEASLGGNVHDVGVDDVVGAGELSRPAVVTGAGCTAGGQEDRERRVYTRAAEPAICDQGFTARELRLLELSLEEQDEAEA